jgi:3-oxoacyl-[acyl-carrier protein] reductase
VRDLAGKAVLITGASLGIGAAAARAFGAAGARVAVHYNSSREEAEQVAATIRAAGSEALLVQADVNDAAAIHAAIATTVAAYGRLDVLINNAGGMVRRCAVADSDPALLEAVLRLNVFSVVTACRTAIQQFRRQGPGGNIINLTSVAARHGGGPGAALYAGSKGFISTFTRGLAKELVTDKIRVNAISPGVIYTPFHQRSTPPEILTAMQASIPMNRLGEAEECAGALLFLASEQLSSYVTGQIIEINGGQFMP